MYVLYATRAMRWLGGRKRRSCARLSSGVGGTCGLIGRYVVAVTKSGASELSLRYTVP